MKTFAYFLIGVVSIFCLSGIVSSKAEASDYLGEFCFTLSGNDVLRLGVLHIGDEHYSISGRHIADDGKVSPIHGNAEVEGSNILMSLNGSKGGGGVESWTFNIILNISTFSGSYDRIKIEHHTEDQPIQVGNLSIDSEIQSSSGFLTLNSCP